MPAAKLVNFYENQKWNFFLRNSSYLNTTSLVRVQDHAFHFSSLSLVRINHYVLNQKLIAPITTPLNNNNNNNNNNVTNNNINKSIITEEHEY